MISPNTNKSLAEVLSNYINTFSKVLNCVKIGEIVSFDKNTQTATIKVLHKRVNEFNLLEKELIEYPPLCDVPVVVMGGGSSYITHPISAGDQCVLLFNDFSMNNWQTTGETMPDFVTRRHDIADAIAIVGLRALPNALENYSDYLNLHYSDNSSIIVGNTIEVNNATVNLNGDTNVTGNFTVSGDQTNSGALTASTLNATNAATGSFVSLDQKVVTVVNGIITSIVGS